MADLEARRPISDHSVTIELACADGAAVTVHASQDEGIESIVEALEAGRACHFGLATTLSMRYLSRRRESLGARQTRSRFRVDDET